MKFDYSETINNLSKKILPYKNNFCMAVVTDTHLDNSLQDTVANISAVDEKIGFDCLVHLGDFMNGNIPKMYTEKILNEQMEMFKKSVKSGIFYPVQGNHDGFTDISTPGMCNVTLDEDWDKVTSFVNCYQNVTRPVGKPYYYVDIKEYNIRLIVLCTFYYTGDVEKGEYIKVYGTDNEQVDWFENEALNVSKETTVLICSHDTPFEQFGDNYYIDNPRPNGNRLMEITKKAMENGIQIAAWFVGHFHGDYVGQVGGVNFILIASETAYVPQLWDMPEGGCYPERILGEESEDLWDVVVIDTEKKKIKLFRFGAGTDREIGY